MTGPTTLQPLRPASSPTWLRNAQLTLLALAVVVVAPLLLTRLMVAPSHIDVVKFENATPYDLRIEASGGNGWVDLGIARHGTTTAIEEVLDQGSSWILRFASQGVAGGELRVTRDDLKRDGWKIVVPAVVGDELEGQGAPPTP